MGKGFQRSGHVRFRRFPVDGEAYDDAARRREIVRRWAVRQTQDSFDLESGAVVSGEEFTVVVMISGSAVEDGWLEETLAEAAVRIVHGKYPSADFRLVGEPYVLDRRAKDAPAWAAKLSDDVIIYAQHARVVLAEKS